MEARQKKSGEDKVDKAGVGPEGEVVGTGAEDVGQGASL